MESLRDPLYKRPVVLSDGFELSDMETRSRYLQDLGRSFFSSFPKPSLEKVTRRGVRFFPKSDVGPLPGVHP